MRPPGRFSLRIGGHGCRQQQQLLHCGPCGRLVPVPVPVVVPWTQAWLGVSVRAFSHTIRPLAAATAGSSGRASTTTTTTTTTPADRMQKSYFLSNGILDRIAGRPPSTKTELAPHRRRQLARRQQQQQQGTLAGVEPHADESASSSSASSSSASSSSASSSSASSSASSFSANPSASSSSAHPSDLPENASSILSDVAASQPHQSARRMASSLLALTKPRLTVLVVLSAMAPYALYPVPAFLTPELLEAGAGAGAAAAAAAPLSLSLSLSPPSLSPLTLLFLTTGTTLCAAAANALNMLYEPDTDARMSRTRNRPLVRLLISRRAALGFAVACGLVGVAALHLGVNPTVAFLGAANIALYAGVYTPMKRLSAANTWVGALVGGIPPLMGWAAAAGESATGTASGAASSPSSPSRHSELRELLFAPDGSSVGGWLLASLLFAWQFPHFMALSWSVRAEYQRAGLRMLAWVNPARNARVALRYSLAFVPICLALCAANVTEWSFAATSLPVNVWLVREAVRFWQLQGHHGSARGLFWASVWHLPVIMVLALLQKKGMWARVWRSVAGAPDQHHDDDDDDDDYDDDDDDNYVWVTDDGKQLPVEPVPSPVSPRR